MASKQDLAGSARRHLDAGRYLHEDKKPGRSPGSKAIAGYLYGLAGELALKQLMRRSGMRPLPEVERRDDPFYAHFPHLKTLLLDQASGRLDSDLRSIASRSELFQYWTIEMRYAPTDTIDPIHTNRWRDQAEELVARMNI